MFKSVSILVVLFFTHQGYAIDIKIFNNTTVDIVYEYKIGNTISASPGEILKIPLHDEVWLDLGAEAVKYDFSLLTNCLKLTSIKSPLADLQVNNNGDIFCVLQEKKLPVRCYKKQPNGFPLKIKDTEDLT